MSNSASRYFGPAWDINSEYSALDSDAFQVDIEELEHTISQIRLEQDPLKEKMNELLRNSEQGSINASSPESIDVLQKLWKLDETIERARLLLANLSTYITCILSIDDRNPLGREEQARINKLQADFEAAGKPFWIFLDRVADDFIPAYLRSASAKNGDFALRQSRLMKDTLLSESEEILLARLKVHGPVLWGELYKQISGRIRCFITTPSAKTEQVGLAQAMAQLRSHSEPERRMAWASIQDGWATHEDACASILNGLAGWRLEEMEFRSKKRPSHFLDLPLHLARIQPETLEAMLSSIKSRIEIPRQAMRHFAKGLGKGRLDPWDLLASAPTKSLQLTTFEDALNSIREAFAAVDPEMAKFVDLARKKNWIEGRVISSKQQGAFCLRFAKSGEPRVFQTYTGTIPDIRTLAHELGHAYHFWLMRDLPVVLHRSPMTLLETASIFAEAAFTDHLTATGNPEMAFSMAWQSNETAATYLLNMPARYDFEKAFYEKRKQTVVSAEELGNLTEDSWKWWYGDTMAKFDRRFWATKLHFSLPWVSFYNYPYTFGYLFSLKIFAMRKQIGVEFIPTYQALLRDTGRMTAEELAKKHLAQDIRKPQFWSEALDIVESQVKSFEKLLNSREPFKKAS